MSLEIKFVITLFGFFTTPSLNLGIYNKMKLSWSTDTFMDVFQINLLQKCVHNYIFRYNISIII